MTSVAKTAHGHPRARSLVVDFGRVGGCTLLGIAGGFAYGLLSGRWDAIFGLVTLVIGPAVVLALMWVATGLQLRTGIRILGASAGWVVFVWLFVQPASNQWLLSFYVPGVVLFVTSLVAASLVGFGLWLSDRIWWKVGRRSATVPQPNEQTPGNGP